MRTCEEIGRPAAEIGSIAEQYLQSTPVPRIGNGIGGGGSSGGGSSSGGSGLAFTGSDTSSVVVRIGAVALVLGVALVLAARTRRNDHVDA